MPGFLRTRWLNEAMLVNIQRPTEENTFEMGFAASGPVKYYLMAGKRG